MGQWTHPTLGSFEISNEDEAWLGFVQLDPFDVYGRDLSRAKSGLPFLFEVDEEDEPPDEARVNVAISIVKNAKSLVENINQAFFNSFAGIGPSCGMYWHGTGDELAQYVGQTKFYSPNDVERLLGGPTVYIGLSGECTVDFCAEFEQEHGISVLTDGQNVL